MIVIDNFLGSFDEYRAHCDTADFNGEINPVDNVFYPGVSTIIPENVVIDVYDKLSVMLNCVVNIKFIFMRLSLIDTVAPHQAHTDISMGQYGMMVYLNRYEDCDGGTSFVRHIKTGMEINPKDKDEEAVWLSDTNNPNAWEIVDMCDMKPNRALIFDANKMHRSEPIGGFGSNSRDGRLVLTVFFDKND